MISSLDAEVRAAAIERVRRLRDVYGGRIPRSALMEGVTIRGQRVPIWNYQKGIFKPAAFGPNGPALSIFTSLGSPYQDIRDFENGTIVYRYQGVDPWHRDSIALRRAMELELPLIYLVGVDPGFYDAIVPVYVSSDSPAT